MQALATVGERYESVKVFTNLWRQKQNGVSKKPSNESNNASISTEKDQVHDIPPPVRNDVLMKFSVLNPTFGPVILTNSNRSLLLLLMLLFPSSSTITAKIIRKNYLSLSFPIKTIKN